MGAPGARSVGVVVRLIDGCGLRGLFVAFWLRLFDGGHWFSVQAECLLSATRVLGKGNRNRLGKATMDGEVMTDQIRSDPSSTFPEYDGI